MKGAKSKMIFDKKRIKIGEFKTKLTEDAIMLIPDFADGLSFNECIAAMCCLFDMKGIYNIRIAINNSVPVDYEQSQLFPEDARALIVGEENPEDLKSVMSEYSRQRFGAIATCFLDKANIKKIHISLFPEDFYEDLMKTIPMFASNRLLVQFSNCSRMEILVFLTLWGQIAKEKLSS